MKRHLLKNNGFTLIEVVIALAIVIVLLAITIPLTIYLKTNLKMKELDDTARELFIASQNRLSAMKASGELFEFESILVEEYPAQNLEAEFGELPPGDYSPGDSKWKGFYYLSSQDSITTTYVMSANAVADAELSGYYVIELDPRSGDTYSVFYSESELKPTYLDTAYSMRNLSERRDLRVGYYCGSDTSALSVPDTFSPDIKVVNKEELYLQITCDDMRSITSSQGNLTVTLTLTDVGTEAVWTKEFVGLRDFTIGYDKMTIDAVLDSMQAGQSFEDITGLTPGNDVVAVVSMEYSYRGIEVSTSPEYPATARFNSLFLSRTDDELKISSLRHLNNLRSSIYSHGSDGDITVLQTAVINYDADKWDEDALCPTTSDRGNPLSSFSPIENVKLFGAGTSPGLAEFFGGKICDMNIVGGDNTGLFSYTNCNISGVRLIDPAVEGLNNTGALIGHAYAGSISDCGVYLSTQDKHGAEYTKEHMLSSLALHTVRSSGSSQYVGGLIGRASAGVSISSSFAAIDVNCPSGSTAGGLIGAFEGSSVENSYSSGDVTARTRAGGLAGIVSRGSFSNCYSTSDVTAQSYAGGFIGVKSGSSAVTLTNCAAYGLTKKADGSADLASSGAFIGGGSNAVYSGCAYLRQNGYMDAFDGVVKSGIAVKTYSQLRPDPVNDIGNSFPYTIDKTAAGAFPFAMVCAEHFGDWPLEFKIDTSLVYYEKYTASDGSVRYGYFAEGYSLGGDEAASNEWTLDTLLSQNYMDAWGYSLVEDGYAIMSIYNLVQMTYKLNSDRTGSTPVTISLSATPGSSSFVAIRQPAGLYFETADGGGFTVQHLYLYQMPFALQETQRDYVQAFYDKLELTCYASGNLTTPVVSDYVYYYCPHFAKNAINPDVNMPVAGRPTDPSSVYVRSPRQMSALGRYTYYWNKGNSGRYFDFYQEIDLNYGKYTKSLCGVRFDLMDTSLGNNLRNRPIGMPMVQSFKDWRGVTVMPGNFQCDYDGQGFKIIDYCLVTYNDEPFQFTGLFGEIYKSVVKNVTLVASDPDNMSGYVISEYNTGTHRPGTGALVGLIYIDTASEDAGVDTIVTNCAVTGYTVIYRTNAAVKYDSVVGGLAGYVMGYLQNSSSDCKLVKIEVPNDGGRALSVGGLCGSVNGHRLSKCYSGGTLELKAAVHTSTKSSIGGVAGGYVYLWNSESESEPFESLAMSDCYSFCTIKKRRTIIIRSSACPAINMTQTH